MIKIDNAMDHEIMRTGTENMYVTIHLTDEEREQFLQDRKYHGRHYSYELYGNKLHIMYRQDPMF